MDKFDLIIAQPEVLGGKPCIKGTRISVDLVLEWFASGATIPGLLEQFPHLTEEGIRQALWYAADVIKNEKVIEIKVA
ncbi:MAG: DUF433 domain-containing protein [Lewinellaceae bacterium]|nr:DUF433 domain-containing protein [Lewinellaceae bacterium]